MYNFFKRAKQHICIILAAIFVFSLLPVSASAVELEETIKAGDHLQWGTYNDNAITWIAISDSSTTGDIYVDVMSKYVLTSRSYHDQNTVPGSFGNTSLYSWLNSKSGFWSEENFPEYDRDIRAKGEFSLMSFLEVIDIFSNPVLEQYAVAKRNGSAVDWWIAGYDETMASQNMTYIMKSSGEIGTELLTDVANTKKGVRPITSLNLDSFYIASGNGSSSDPYVIRSVYNSEVKSMSVSGCALSPSFKTSKFDYTSTVTDNVESITIEAKASDSNASLTVYNGDKKIDQSDGSFKVPLEYGENEIKVRVLAVDDFTETVYNINVTREEPQNTLFVTSFKFFEENPRDELLLSPSFDESIYNYTIDVGKSIDTGRIEYVGAPNSAVKVSLNGGDEMSLGAPNEQGVLSNTFNVTGDLTLITLTVTSENEREVRKYVINVEHGEIAGYVNPRVESSQPPVSEEQPPEIVPPQEQEAPAEEESGGGIIALLVVLIIIAVLAIVAGVVLVVVFVVKRRKNMPTNDQIDEILRNDRYPIDNDNSSGNRYMPINSQYRSGNQPQNRPVQPNSSPSDTPIERSAQPMGTVSPAANAQAQPMGSVNMEQTRVIGSVNAPTIQQDEMEYTRVVPGMANAEQDIMSGMKVQNDAFDDMDATAFDNMSIAEIDNSQPVEPQPAAEIAEPNVPTESAEMPVEIPEEKPRFVLNFDADKEINMEALHNQHNNSEISSGKPDVEDIYSGQGEDPVKILEDKIDYDPNIDIFSSSEPMSNDSDNESIVDDMSDNIYSGSETDYRLDIDPDENF